MHVNRHMRGRRAHDGDVKCSRGVTLRASSFATAGSFSALRPKMPVTAPVMSDSFCLNLTTLPEQQRRTIQHELMIWAKDTVNRAMHIAAYSVSGAEALRKQVIEQTASPKIYSTSANCKAANLFCKLQGSRSRGVSEQLISEVSEFVAMQAV